MLLVWMWKNQWHRFGLRWLSVWKYERQRLINFPPIQLSTSVGQFLCCTEMRGSVTQVCIVWYFATVVGRSVMSLPGR